MVSSECPLPLGSFHRVHVTEPLVWLLPGQCFHETKTQSACPDEFGGHRTSSKNAPQSGRFVPEAPSFPFAFLHSPTIMVPLTMRHLVQINHGGVRSLLKFFKYVLASLVLRMKRHARAVPMWHEVTLPVGIGPFCVTEFSSLKCLTMPFRRSV